MPRKKALFMIQLPPPHHGVSIFNQTLISREYICERLEIDVIRINTARFFVDIAKWHPRKVLSVLATCAMLTAKLLFKHYDIFYITLCPTGPAFYRDLLYIFLARLFGVKRIYHLHGQGIAPKLTQRFLRGIYRWCFQDATVLLLAKSLYKDVADLIPLSQCRILPNALPAALDDAAFDAIVARRVQKKDPPRIVFLSNLLISKGALVLLNALVTLHREIAFTAVFCGGWYDDGCQERFMRTVKEAAMEKSILLPGFCTGEDKHRYLSEADIFVHPTLNDTYALVILEAMEYGLPVVSTYEGAIPEIIAHGTDGFLTRKNSSEELVAVLRLLITDQALRTRLGAAARKKFITKYLFRTYEKSFVAILNEEEHTCAALTA